MGSSSLTILFDPPFWVGLYERYDGGQYTVCRTVFGAEPRDGEVYGYYLQNWNRLSFSPPMETDGRRETPDNPKRRQREIQKQLQTRPVGTKAQQAIKLQQEQSKVQRVKRSKTRREEEQERQYRLRREKAKEKHRGH